jgi:hypothetical protein
MAKRLFGERGMASLSHEFCISESSIFLRKGLDISRDFWIPEVFCPSCRGGNTSDAGPRIDFTELQLHDADQAETKQANGGGIECPTLSRN